MKHIPVANVKVLPDPASSPGEVYVLSKSNHSSL